MKTNWIKRALTFILAGAMVVCLASAAVPPAGVHAEESEEDDGTGKNYKFLCRGTTVTADPVTSLYVTTVYQDAEGNCSITENQVFDLTAYVTPAE